MGGQVVICADDYGMSEGVSQGILELAMNGRISATSAMTAAPGWPELARGLAPVADRIAVGLHLTFTGLGPLGPMPAFAPSGRFPALRHVVRAAITGRLPLAEITDEISRQLDAFEAAMGRPPDFIDGHQHVHALPGLGRTLLWVLLERQARPWLRDPSDRVPAILARRAGVGKALAVAALSAGFGRAARRAGFVTNRGFSGFSDFDPSTDLAQDFARFFVAPGPAHLVMCHPGRVAAGETLDGVTAPRERELAYLGSEGFPALLEKRGLVLATRPT